MVIRPSEDRLQRAIARVGQRAIGHLDLEKTIALYRHVELLARLGQFAFGENAGGRDGLRAVADLQAGGQLVAIALVRAGRADVFVKQVLKFDLALLESRRVDVREVVGNHIQIKLL